MPTALITGCSAGGIGAALAIRFAQEGYIVFATARNVSKAAPLANQENITVLPLDVTDGASIAQCMAELNKRIPDGRLDLLINNAGMGAAGPLIDVDLSTAKRLYDVNVFGLLAVTQACISLLIRANGKVVNVSSVGGLLHLPFGGLYHSSKAAVTIMSETLRLELAPLGITVITAMCGHIESNFHGNDAWDGLSASSYYKPLEKEVARVANGTVGPGVQKLDVFINNLTKDILGGASGQIYRGAFAQVTRWLSYHFPTRLLVSTVMNGFRAALIVGQDLMILPDSGLNRLAKLIKKDA